MTKLNKAQRAAVKRKYDQNPDSATSYRDFRRRVQLGGLGSDRYAMMKWCGMWLGIETDGETHS